MFSEEAPPTTSSEEAPETIASTLRMEAQATSFVADQQPTHASTTRAMMCRGARLDSGSVAWDESLVLRPPKPRKRGL